MNDTSSYAVFGDVAGDHGGRGGGIEEVLSVRHLFRHLPLDADDAF